MLNYFLQMLELLSEEEHSTRSLMLSSLSHHQEMRAVAKYMPEC